MEIKWGYIMKYILYEDKYKNYLCDMINALYQEDPEGEPMSQDKIELTIRQAQEYSDRLKIYMIMDGDILAGYAIVQLIWSNEWGGLTANIDEMYIAENHRNQGLASGFINDVKYMLPQVNRVTLEVTPSNDGALMLYEKLGFRLAENRNMEKILG